MPLLALGGTGDGRPEHTPVAGPMMPNRAGPGQPQARPAELLATECHSVADPEIPDSRSPDSRFGRETGRELPIPDSAGNGNRRSPVSRFGRETGIGAPIGRNSGNRGYPAV